MVNDLKNFVDPISFASDTNLFLSYENKNVFFFENGNQELKHVNEKFDANKLSLNLQKTQFILFHKEQARDNTPLKLNTVTLNSFDKKRDPNEFSWSNHRLRFFLELAHWTVKN